MYRLSDNEPERERYEYIERRLKKKFILTLNDIYSQIDIDNDFQVEKYFKTKYFEIAENIPARIDRWRK